MRVGHEAAFGTVTFETDVTIGMASLTGGQVFSRFTGVAAGPQVARQHRIGVTTLALLVVKEGMITTEGAIGEPFAMGLKCQIGAVEIVMSADAKLVFMTCVTKLRVGTSSDGVGDGELGTVDVGHGVTEVPHLVGTTGLVAVETKILLMTGRTINGLGQHGAAMSQRPGYTVGD